MTNQSDYRPLEILLVEDNAADVSLILQALKEGNLHSKISAVKDGTEALKFLRREGTYADAVRPDIILLDLNLPGKNGHEVLGVIKEEPDLKKIPVIVLTASTAEEDIVRTYELHANCYVVKPIGLDQFINTVRGIENFWHSIAKLPS